MNSIRNYYLTTSKLFNYCNTIHTTNLDLNSSRKYCIFIPTIQSVHSGNKSIKYYCAVLWNDFMTKKKYVKKNSDHKDFIYIDSIHHLYSFKRLIRNHFLNLYKQN